MLLWVTFTAPIQLPGLALDPRWYRRAVFYEVLVRAFSDSDGDGVGDLGGLIAKLDYLQWLGVDAIWVPPFYLSPMRDGGYDVADFRSVQPELGSIDDVHRLVSDAHARGMRVVMDFPLNHTSDQHEWFKQSRADPDGPYGDWYVWRDANTGYPNTRIIFTDTEDSNWAFDSERRQFYFHRFFSHQPDLNYENPAVRAEMLDTIRYWFGMGVDGMRLDAIPYLFESEDGDGEGEPPTHAFLREVRAMVDREYPGRMLLAEANAWPDEVATYFGTDDAPEAHMAFDFPVMPRVFYAMRSQHAGELVKVLAEGRAAVPEGAAWGAFLRNHDELSLEMVSEEYRHAMYGWYAYDPRMRANVGIRRRLAPLLDNDREEIELAHALLLSLAGSPFLYYGDEIGMGDNIWLEDRDASRTPMQWTPDRNAGFSSADPGKLYLPVVQSLVYQYQSVNVEAQLAQSRSLLRWLRGAIHVRKQHAAFPLGTLRVASSDHESVLAYVREYAGSEQAFGDPPETILCVFSFAHSPVAARIALPEHAGASAFDLFGGGRFPNVREDGVLEVTLGARGYYWLRLERPAAA